VSTRSCPDWPELVELAPDLHFKHYTVGEARVPSEVLAQVPQLSLDTVAVCADLEHHVFNPAHTDERLAAALKETYWYDVHEWAKRTPGG
jgi:hypothetical protein